MIPKIIVHSCTTGTNAVCIRIFDAYEECENKNDIHLRGIILQLKSIAVSLSDVVEQIKGESLLEEKDLLRDNAIRDFYYLIQGLSYHPQENMRSAARRLLDTFGNSGLGILNKSYGIKTSMINLLLMELSKPEIKISEILLSGTIDAINKINKTQSDFETTYLEYGRDKIIGINVESASSINKNVIEIINGRLVSYLNGMMSVDEKKYGEFARIIEQIIIDNNKSLNEYAKCSTLEEVFI